MRPSPVMRGTHDRAATTRLLKSRLLHLFALLLLLAGCSTLSKNTVLIRGSVDARLVTRVNGGLFLTTGRIGDRQAGPFLIDTGSQSLYLDSELARSLNPSFWGEGDNPQVKQKVKWGTLDSLEVGPVTLQNTDVAVMDLSVPSTTLGERLAGILGHPFFAHAIVEVDYPAGSIACFDPKTYRLRQGEWLPLTFEAGRPIIPARIEGNIDGQFILDTGSNFAVLFYPDFVQKHGLLDNRETREHKMMLVDGLHEALGGKIGWVELAGHRFEQPIAFFAPSDMLKSFPKGVAGIIGQGFLRRFTIVFNYPGSKIALLLK